MVSGYLKIWNYQIKESWSSANIHNWRRYIVCFLFIILVVGVESYVGCKVFTDYQAVCGSQRFQRPWKKMLKKCVCNAKFGFFCSATCCSKSIFWDYLASFYTLRLLFHTISRILLRPSTKTSDKWCTILKKNHYPTIVAISQNLRLFF